MNRKIMNYKQADILLKLNGKIRFTGFFQELGLTTKFLKKQGFIQKNNGYRSGFTITFPPDFDYSQWRQQYEQSIKEKQLGHSKNSPWRRTNRLMYDSYPLYTSDYRTNN
ncbi:hypothetical protein [Lyngbya sp. PCC 8106]|uniref:hypothetical protein n=1 Tax=Lyngbya sp. (strain PCC 8106) TaxID=313612 RepID=UPI0000EA9940|nr:hypothetical protein [Lyngbya sp. PCC 8106]EAW35225.1 hypothetical protein L8106_13960 [Lyngbya sp. PCC 8106]